MRNKADSTRHDTERGGRNRENNDRKSKPSKAKQGARTR
jgi:hypothetical protein